MSNERRQRQRHIITVFSGLNFFLLDRSSFFDLIVSQLIVRLRVQMCLVFGSCGFSIFRYSLKSLERAKFDRGRMYSLLDNCSR